MKVFKDTTIINITTITDYEEVITKTFVKPARVMVLDAADLDELRTLTGKLCDRLDYLMTDAQMAWADGDYATLKAERLQLSGLREKLW